MSCSASWWNGTDLEVCSRGGGWRDCNQSYRQWREIRKTERYGEKKRRWVEERREGGEREGGREGGPAGGSGARERKGEKSFPESSLVDFPVRCFPQSAELTPNKGRKAVFIFI